ncbi:MAG: diguanylate phosphodiesterase [Pseudohongiella sp.]|nr:MAG: diguanylate phosphodiesterase [Pseudohongiella sp.]
MRAEAEIEQHPKLLVIDDDEGITDFIKNVTEEMDYSVNCVHDYESIGKNYNTFRPDIIFLDLRLPGHDGIQVLHFLASLHCNSRIFLISGIDRITLDSAAEVGKQINLDIAGVLSKPFLIEDIQQVLGNKPEPLSLFTSKQFETLLGNGNFEIYYTPRMAIKSLAGSAIAAVEVGVVWNGVYGQKQTLDSIKAKIHSGGMLHTLYYTILDKALETYKGWHDRGTDIDIVFCLDNTIIQDSAFPNYLATVANKWGVTPSSLSVSISGSIAQSKSPMLLDTLTRLRIKGFNLEVQTSGTDNTELDNVMHLPFNQLKLDPSIVKSLSTDLDAEFNVSTLISLAEKLGLSTCAAGVDCEASFKFVYGCGCTVGQGEYFSEPLEHFRVENFDVSDRQEDEGAANQFQNQVAEH